MLLVSAKVGPFKSIDTPQTVQIERDVTVLVGMNEAGKTVFLQALEKSADAVGSAKFDPVEDYPRKDFTAYMRRHKTDPDDVTELWFRLEKAEVQTLNSTLHLAIPEDLVFSVRHTYANGINVGLHLDEAPALSALIEGSGLSQSAKTAAQTAKRLRDIPSALSAVNLAADPKDQAFVTKIQQRIAAAAPAEKWDSVIEWEAWQWLKTRVPKFLYFGEYELLPSKLNLADLASCVAQVTANQANAALLTPEHRGVLALLRIASITLDEFTGSGGYEPLKARLEGVSIALTDQIMAFWKQNEDLEVEVDIKPDPNDSPPFNNGPNLYLRIKNRRHRGVSTPFRQRSRGFIWFFSFLVWFDNVRHQLQQAGEVGERDLILLLDEPGLNLHALAQADFLHYIDELSEKHQVLYTTHSPFMIDSDELDRVRVVEDRPKEGTIISENIGGADERTMFPLQAALGWTIAQNLFISKRNLLVEGPADLIYLTLLSSALESAGRTGLRDDVKIAPTGGVDKIVTFVALLGASGLKLAILHDYKGSPDQRILDLIRQKLIPPKAVLDASQFRDLKNLGKQGPPTDLEDLFAVPMYLDYFNRAFEKRLGKTVAEKDLPPGDRVIDRLDRYLGTSLRPKGGFNHYTVASTFARYPPAAFDADTLTRFEQLFRAVNELFPS